MAKIPARWRMLFQERAEITGIGSSKSSTTVRQNSRVRCMVCYDKRLAVECLAEFLVEPTEVIPMRL